MNLIKKYQKNIFLQIMGKISRSKEFLYRVKKLSLDKNLTTLLFFFRKSWKSVVNGHVGRLSQKF